MRLWEAIAAGNVHGVFYPAAGFCLPDPKVSLYSETGGFLPVFLLESEGVIKQVKLWALDPLRPCEWARVLLQNLKLSHVWGRQKRLIFFFLRSISIYICLTLYPLRI